MQPIQTEPWTPLICFNYMVITFATVGYGDIHPVRFNGMIYGELVAMVIGLTSMFSTACFVRGSCCRSCSDELESEPGK